MNALSLQKLAYNPYTELAKARREEFLKTQAPPPAEGINPTLLYGAGGATAGATLGALLGKKKNRAMNAVLGGAMGGGAGLLLQHLLQKKSAEQPTTKQANMQALVEKLMPYLQAAKTTGSNFLKSPVGQQALGGGAIGAGLGGLYGLMAPGEDEYGNRRNRFGSMLRGALGGGALGAGAGGALGYFAPNAAGDAYQTALKRLGLGPKPELNTANPKTPAELALAAEQGRGGNYAKSYRGAKSDPFSESLVKGEAQRFRDAQLAAAPGTMGGQVKTTPPALAGNSSLESLTGKAMAMPAAKPFQSPTYTPTAPGAGARRAAINAEEQATRDRISGKDVRRALSGKANPGLLDSYRPAAEIQQERLEEATGVQGATPELLQMMRQNPAEFARMIEQAKEKVVQENVRSAPSRNVDTSGIDFSNPTPFTSPTLGY